VNWFRVATGITRHPKVYALARELGIGRLAACGYVLCLLEWAATLDTETVELPALLAASIIAEACGYVGDPPDLIGAFARSGWLDMVGRYDDQRVRLHGWEDMNGSSVRDARSAKARMQKLRESRRDTPECSPNRSAHPVRLNQPTNPPTNQPTNQIVVPTAEKTLNLAVVPPPAPAAPAKRARKVQAQAGEPNHQKLVEVWSAVYLARTGQPYRYQPADFVQAALLHRQGVTPDEVAAASERAFRPNIPPYLAVRSFKQLASRFSEVKVAGPVVQRNGHVGIAHNVASDYDNDPLFKPLK